MIFIPKKINVCFQKRKNDLCNKLGFITYFDEKNKMRKSETWNRWSDKNIPTLLTTNDPISGFIIDNAIGGINSCSDRIAWCRVYDPRGFEIEITVPNLLWILESTSCDRKRLSGEFVYAWGDAGELLLVSTQSKEYDSLIKERDKLFARKPFSPQELIEGHIYKTRGGTQLLYMGRFNKWEISPNYAMHERYYYNDSIKDRRYFLPEQCLKEYSIKDKLNPYDNLFPKIDYKYKQSASKQRFFFFYEPSPHYDKNLGKKRNIRRWQDGDWSPSNDNLKTFKTISGKFIEDLGRCELYEGYKEKLEHEKEFSPIDFKKSSIHRMSFEEFQEIFDSHGYTSEIKTINDNKGLIDAHFSYEYNDQDYPYLVNGIKYNLEELYDCIKPYYGIYYLQNGNIYGYVGKGE